MTSFLLLLSFLIHAILFITIYHLYEKTKKDKNEQLARLEELFADFMKNIQLENEKLEQKIYEAEMRQQVLNETAPNATLQNELNEVKPIVLNEQKLKDNQTKDVWDHSKLIEEKETKDMIETSIEGQVLQLFHEGKSPEEIAKQLNRGKTEVDLYIKLHKMANNT